MRLTNPDDTGRRQLRKIEFRADTDPQRDPLGDEYEGGEGYETDKLEDATLICSDIIGTDGTHLPVIDIDFPIKAIPSSTPGHFHLYIDKEVAWDKYLNMLNAMADAGIVQRGYVGAAERRGHTDVRLPWVHKKEPEPLSDDDLPGMRSRSDFL